MHQHVGPFDLNAICQQAGMSGVDDPLLSEWTGIDTETLRGFASGAIPLSATDRLAILSAITECYAAMPTEWQDAPRPPNPKTMEALAIIKREALREAGADGE